MMTRKVKVSRLSIGQTLGRWKSGAVFCCEVHFLLSWSQDESSWLLPHILGQCLALRVSLSLNLVT